MRFLVDRLTPGLGDWYRRARDRHWAAHPVRVPEGFLFCGSPPFRSENWERNERRTFQQELDSADVCIDIGANVGFYACFALARGKRVVAIEPLRRNLTLLERNLAVNRFTGVEVHAVGLGSRAGVAVIHGRAEVASFIPGWSRTSGAHHEDVAVETLDALLANRFVEQRLLIKVDVEGFELEVLRGADVVLQAKPRPVWMVEVLLVNPLNGRINPHFAEVFGLFRRYGYAAAHVGDTLRPVDEPVVADWLKKQSLSSSLGVFLFRAGAPA